MAKSRPDRLLREQLLLECRAMAKYAFASGLKVPQDVVEKLDALEQIAAEAEALPADAGETSTLTGFRGDSLDLGRDAARLLARIHHRLAEVVAPATPKTILLLATEETKSGWLTFLGAVPLVRRLMVVSILSLIGFVWVSLSPDVDGKGFDLLENSGYVLLLSELFLLFAASIGASFANLFEAQRYIKDGTFDPKYESAYWVRYVLGLMAGTILALLIPLEALAAEQGEAGGSNILEQLGQPMMALLGGFAASAVYRILHRVVAALESLVQGDTHQVEAARERVAKARVAENDIQNRMKLSSRLMTLEQKLVEAKNPDAMRAELKKIQKQLIGSDDEEDDNADATPAPGS